MTAFSSIAPVVCCMQFIFP